MGTVLWVVVPIAAVAAMYWLSFRIEPHWVSKDGRRFVCNVQPITARGEAEGRATETRVVVQVDGGLRLSKRRVFRRSLDEVWRVTGKSDRPPKRRAVYLLHVDGDDGSAGQMALKLPDTSRAVPILDEILARRTAR